MIEPSYRDVNGRSRPERSKDMNNFLHLRDPVCLNLIKNQLNLPTFGVFIRKDI